MRHAQAVGAGWFGGPNLKLAIDSNRIATYDLTLQPFSKTLSKMQRERGFSAGRGTKHHHEQGQAHTPAVHRPPQTLRNSTKRRMSKTNKVRPSTCCR